MVTMRLPVPHRILSPNERRSHWAARSRHVRVHRERAQAEALSQIGDLPILEFPAAVFVLIKTKSKANRVKRVWNPRDRDNFLAACKSYIDGLSDTGLFGVGDHRLRSFGEFVSSDTSDEISHVMVYIGELDEIMEVLKWLHKQG